VYQFQEFRRFLRGDVEQLEHDLLAGVPLAGGMVADPVRIFYLSQSKFAAYFQDNWKLRPSFTLNLGLRYEYMTLIEEANGKFSNLRNITDPLPEIGLRFTNPTTKMFSPRVGFAWSPGGNNQSAVRGGFGIFYMMPDLVYYALVTQEMVPFNVAGFLNKADAIRLGHPQGIDFPRGVESQTNLLASVPSYRTLEYNQKPTYVYRWNFKLERQMGNWFGSVGYDGSRGVHLPTQTDANQAKWIGYPAPLTPGLNEKQWATVPAGTIGAPINPGFANIWVNAQRASSFYHGLSLNVQRRMARGLRVQGSYNFSKNTDFGSGSSNQTESLPQNQRIDLYWDWGRTKGLSQLMHKHNFVSNFTWDLPQTGWTGVAGTLLNGWQTNGILTLTSGTPFTVYDGNIRPQQEAMRRIGRHRPNLASGGNNNPVTGNPDRWFDPEQFIPSTCRASVPCYTLDARGRPVGDPRLGYQVGFLGNLGNNTVIGPKLATFDFSLDKNFSITETMQLQFRSEFFNLFNTPNWRVPNRTTLFTSNGARDVRAGLVEDTITSPREIQFGLKFVF
jgi:hypothetical protein